MQELMLRHKTTTFSPRDCLKTILHQRWSKTCSGKHLNPNRNHSSIDHSDNRPVPKIRRKRKNATGTDPPPIVNNGTTSTKKRSMTNIQPPTQEITNMPGVISFSIIRTR